MNDGPNLSKMTDAESVRRFMAYHHGRGGMDAYRAGFRRLCEIEGRSHDDPLETDFWRAIIAGEELLHQKHRRRVLLARTRQKIGRAGVRKTVEDLVSKKEPSDGFFLLVEGGLWDLTAEFLAIKHADQFSPATVDAARTRLRDAGVQA